MINPLDKIQNTEEVILKRFYSVRTLQKMSYLIIPEAYHYLSLF